MVIRLIKRFRYSPLNSTRKLCDSIDYGTDYICVREQLEKNTFGVVCTLS